MSSGSKPVRATLAAVAERAGVSASTASIAFSGTGPVSAETRQRVLDAAAELNYAGPDPRARSLRRGRSGIVGVVMEERLGLAFRDPVNIASLDGIADALTPSRSALLLLAGAEEGTGIIDAPMDAVVLMGCNPRAGRSIPVLRRRGIPMVGIEAEPDRDVVPISLDNREASHRIAEHVRSLGHVRVATVTLPLDDSGHQGSLTADLEARGWVGTSLDRLAGAREVYPDLGGVVTLGSFVEEGMRAGTALLDRPAGERPTAVIAQSDLLAAGVFFAAERLGLRIPADLTVVGFDGVRVDGLPVPLTTMVQPATAKGRAAGEAVLAMLRDEPGTPVSFTSEFREGGTSGPVPGA